MTDLSLPETVIALERLDLLPETRQIVEEAARLLQEGREMEARALVEKAEALAAQPRNGKTNGNGNGHHKGNGNGEDRSRDKRWASEMITPIAEKLAAGFTTVLSGVLEDIYQHTGEQMHEIASVLERRIHGVEEAIEKAPVFEDRLHQLFGEQEALRQAHQKTSSALDQWQQAGLESRLAAVEERVTGIDQVVRELQPQMSTALTRMDQHTDALRSLEQRQARRVSALNQVLENLSRLREEEPAPETSLPLM